MYNYMYELCNKDRHGMHVNMHCTVLYCVNINNLVLFF